MSIFELTISYTLHWLKFKKKNILNSSIIQSDAGNIIEGFDVMDMIDLEQSVKRKGATSVLWIFNNNRL